MRIKKIATSCLLAALLICTLNGCFEAPNRSLAEQYLNSHSDEELFAEFSPAITSSSDDTLGFSNPSALSSSALFRFACQKADSAMVQKWSCDEGVPFRIPLADVKELLDEYFKGYNFVPEDCVWVEYNSENQEFEVWGISPGKQDLCSPVFADKKAVGEDVVQVVFHDLLRPFVNMTVTAKVTETGVRFTSCIFEKQPTPGGLEPFDEQELTDITMSMEEYDVLFGKPVNIIKTPTGYDSVVITRTYNKAVCEFISYLSNGEVTKTELWGMDVTSPDYSALRGIHVGDSLDSVIAKFPDAGGETYEQSGKTVRPLYGVYGEWFTYGCVISQNNQPIRVELCDPEWRVMILLDDYQCVSSIRLKETARGE